MKKIALFFIPFTFLFINNIYSSHIAGGEITWQCLSTGPNTGKYIFQLKIYRDCNGIGLFPSPEILDVFNCPGITSITCNYVFSTDLTTLGCGYTCNNPQGNLGAVEEYINRSNPVTLNGIPPAAGWIFYWDNICCRNNVDNVTGEFNMVIRSKMFAFNGQNAHPCFDSSPYFAEKPASFLCIGYEFNYNNGAFDNDRDSLSHGWDYAMDNGATGGGLGAPLIYLPGYSVNSQLPGAPNLDALNGQLTIFPTTGTPNGNFVSVIRAASYRCNQKIAEVFREIQVRLSTACPQTILGPNQPPMMNPPPFPHPVTQIPTYWADTVYAGDTVRFNLNFGEYDINLNGSFQHAILDCNSPQFATNYSTSPPGNCVFPPCAYITDTAAPYLPTPPPISTVNGVPVKAIGFFWPTSCDHVSSVSCSPLTTYDFLMRLRDDACPVPAFNSKTVSITVMGPQITANGDTLTTNFPNGTLQWYMNGNAIPGATGSSYIALTAASYTVAATLQGSNCEVSSSGVTAGPVAVNELYSGIDLNIYPNPSNGSFTIEINSTNSVKASLSVYDVRGEVVLINSITLLKGKTLFKPDLIRLPKGVYILKLHTENGELVRKLILE